MIKSKKMVMLFILFLIYSTKARRLLDKRCLVSPSPGHREENVMAPWTHASANCPGFYSISIVQCDGYCQNPVTGERLSSYHVEEILHEILLPKRNGSLAAFDIPVACKCVHNRGSTIRNRPKNSLAHIGYLMRAFAKSNSRCCPCSSVSRR